MNQQVARMASIALSLAHFVFANTVDASHSDDQSGTIAGKVVDERGIGIQWANVVILNCQRGAQTDRTGTARAW